MGGVNRQVTLAARPGASRRSPICAGGRPRPSPDRARCSCARWLSLDPYMRGRMSAARSYAKPTEIGEAMTGQGVGEVVASDDPRFSPATRSSVSSAGRTTRSLAAERPQGRPAARAAADRPPRARRDRPHRLLRPLRRRQAEARRHGRRLGAHPARSARSSASSRRSPAAAGRRARRRRGEGGGPDRALRLRRRDRLQGGRPQRRA